MKTSSVNSRIQNSRSRAWVAVMVVPLLTGLSWAESPLITAPGSYSYPESSAQVVFEESGESALIIRLTYKTPNGSVATGTGKDSPMKVAAHKWAAQIVPPNELWIHDGLGGVTLYERTIKPSGFKVTSSSVRPKVLERAPKQLLETVSVQGKPEK